MRLANKCVNTSMLVFLTQGASDSRCECRCDDLALLDALGGWLGFLDVHVMTTVGSAEKFEICDTMISNDR